MEGSAALHQVQLESEEEVRSAIKLASPGFNSLESISFLQPEFENSCVPSLGAKAALEQNDTYTVNEAIDHLGFGWFQGALLCYSGLAWAADAMEMMLLSFLGPAARCNWNLSSTQESMITSVVFLGTMLGANAWGALSDAKGRRVGFQGCSVFVFVFGLLSAAAPNYWLLLFARFMVGLGLGGVPVAFALFAEFCPLRGRGGWLIALQSWWTLGSMAEAGLAWAVLVPLGWRVLLALSAVPFVLLLALYPLLPESPHYLAVQGRLEEAAVVLQRIASWNGRSLPRGILVSDSLRRHLSPSSVDGEGRRDLKPTTSDTPTPSADGMAGHEQQACCPAPAGSHPAESSGFDGLAGCAALFKSQAIKERGTAVKQSVHRLVQQLFSPTLRRTTLMLLFIWFANAISYYGLVLLATTIHVRDSDTACSVHGSPNLSSSAFRKIFLTSTAELPGMVLAAVIVEVVSRKRTLFAALGMCALCTAALMASDQSVFLWGGRAAIMGAFAVLFIYTPEVFPTTVRSLGLGVTNSFSRIGGIMSPFVAVALVQAGYLHVAVGIIAGFCALAASFALLLPIETKGRALMDDAESAEHGCALPTLDRGEPSNHREDASGSSSSGREAMVDPSNSNSAMCSHNFDGQGTSGLSNWTGDPSDTHPLPAPHNNNNCGSLRLAQSSRAGTTAQLTEVPLDEGTSSPRQGLLPPGSLSSSMPPHDDAATP